MRPEIGVNAHGMIVDLTKATKSSGWSATRDKIEAEVLGVLGKLPTERGEPQTKTVGEIPGNGYVRRRINYFADEWERISAWLFVPDGREEQQAILCCHEAVPQGKAEPAGIEGDPSLALAQHYAELGYVTIATDCITVGERVYSGQEPFDTTVFYKDNPNRSALDKMLCDHIAAIDVLCELTQVDAARIGVAGHGFGGLNALLLAAFDERIQACVASCAFTRFAADDDPARWARDEGMVLCPKLADVIKAGKLSFDWEHILALAAPSSALVITALNDERLSNTKSCEEAVRLASSAYKLLGASDALASFCHKEGHRMPYEALQAADEWFERWL